MKPAFPPSYIIVPVSIARASVDDALIVTMARILGLCWVHGHKRTPALTLDQLADLTGRPRSTLHRHLARLEEELGWLRIDHDGRRLVLRPLVGQVRGGANPPADSLRSTASEAVCLRTGQAEPAGGLPSPPQCRASHPPAASAPLNEELRQALAEAGIENPARDQLACDANLDPGWVRAWHLWTQHSDRANLSNATGLIVRRLQNHDPPPPNWLELAALTGEEQAALDGSRWTGSSGLNDKLARLRPLYLDIWWADSGE